MHFPCYHHYRCKVGQYRNWKLETEGYDAYVSVYTGSSYGGRMVGWNDFEFIQTWPKINICLSFGCKTLSKEAYDTHPRRQVRSLTISPILMTTWERTKFRGVISLQQFLSTSTLYPPPTLHWYWKNCNQVEHWHCNSRTMLLLDLLTSIFIAFLFTVELVTCRAFSDDHCQCLLPSCRFLLDALLQSFPARFKGFNLYRLYIICQPMLNNMLLFKKCPFLHHFVDMCTRLAF